MQWHGGGQFVQKFAARRRHPPNCRKGPSDIAREFKAAGKTVLLVSHVLSEVEELCDEVAVLVAGRVAFRGTMAALTRDPATGAPRPLDVDLLDAILEEVGELPL